MFTLDLYLRFGMLVQIDDIDDIYLAPRFLDMKKKALRSSEIAPVSPVSITPGREAAADGEATEDIINKIAQLSETSATSPHRLLARARSIKRNPSRQA